MDGDALLTQGAGTVRTLRRQGRVVGLIDVRGRLTVGARAIPGAGLPTRTARVRDAGVAGERGGLPRDRPARRLELFFQLVVFASQALALRLRAPQILAQPFVFTAQLLQQLLRVARRWSRVLSDLLLISDRSVSEKYKELMATI